MRRDVYLENDSGGFSVLAADAVDAIIADGRSDDLRFVKERKAMLVELYGDDSMPVRIVVDEPLRPDEEDQWLARYTWQLDTSDGRLLVMGGFDPDVLSWWKDAGGEGDGRGIGAVTATPGTWRVDVYAHVGSMNGRAILSDVAEKPGSAFRRSHPDRAFPLWLAKMLEFSGDEDPGFEEVWNDVKASIEAGKLVVDTEGGDAIGFLVHCMRSNGPLGDPPEDIWFGRADNGRVPEPFPLGLASEVPDPDLRSFYDKILGIEHPEPPRPIATSSVEIIEVWAGDTLEPVDGGPVPLALEETYLLFWMAAMTSDSTPRFEVWVEPEGQWTPPAPTPDFAVSAKRAVTAIGPVENTGGWHTWWAAREVAKVVAGVPDGSTIDLGMARNAQEEHDPEHNPAIGRALYSGKVSGGRWQIAEASPKVSRAMLEEALTFTRDMANNRIQVRNAAEREMFDAAAAMNFVKPETIHWEGNVPSLTDRPDDREFILIAQPLFRARFGSQWPVDIEEPDEDNDDE